MRFWQVFESRRMVPAQSVFGLSLPNWKSDSREAESRLRLQLDGEYPNYAMVYINMVGTVMADINGEYSISARTPAEMEDKLSELGTIKYSGYVDKQ